MKHGWRHWREAQALGGRAPGDVASEKVSLLGLFSSDVPAGFGLGMRE